MMNKNNLKELKEQIENIKEFVKYHEEQAKAWKECLDILTEEEEDIEAEEASRRG